MTAKELMDRIRHTGRRPRSYSGRGMYGRECVGVSLRPGDYGSELPAEGQRRDALGKGEIAYWPRVEWPADVEEED